MNPQYLSIKETWGEKWMEAKSASTLVPPSCNLENIIRWPLLKIIWLLSRDKPFRLVKGLMLQIWLPERSRVVRLAQYSKPVRSLMLEFWASSNLLSPAGSSAVMGWSTLFPVRTLIRIASYSIGDIDSNSDGCYIPHPRMIRVIIVKFAQCLTGSSRVATPSLPAVPW